MKSTIVLLAATLSAATVAEAQTSLRGRPLVLLLHGRNQQQRTNQQLEIEWFGALRQGLTDAGAGQLLTVDDYRMVFYQDLYAGGPLTTQQLCPGDVPIVAELDRLREDGERFATAERSASDLVTGLQAEMRLTARMMSRGSADAITTEDLQAFEQQRVALGEANAVLMNARERSMTVTQAILAKSTELAQDRAERSARQARSSTLWSRVRNAVAALFAGDLAKIDVAMNWLFPDTDLYITRETYQCATDARLSAQLLAAKDSGRPVILVAHSMGTLVAFNLLVQDDAVARRKGRAPEYAVAAFVTLGSQLGIEPLVQDIIGRSEPPFPSPRSVATWRNLRGEVDWVAPKAILGTYEVQHMVPPYTEYQIRTASQNPHDITQYLRHRATARTIAAAWCRSFSNGAAVPNTCAGITDLGQGQLPPGTTRVWPR